MQMGKDAGGLAGNPGLENTGGQLWITWEVSPCSWDHANLQQGIPVTSGRRLPTLGCFLIPQ